VRRWIVPLVCFLVAGAAVAAALLTRSPRRPATAKRPFIVFPDSAVVRWSSLENAGPLTLAGDGRYWLAFRVFALGSGGALSLDGADGSHLSLRVGPEPAIRFVGPLSIHAASTYWLTPSPAAHGAGARAAGTVFLSGARLFKFPVAALPGAGFWPSSSGQEEADHANWLSAAGTVDVASATHSQRRVWLSFNVVSLDRPQTLTLSQGRSSYRVSVPERGASSHVTVGPFALQKGVARVRFSAPDARTLGTDRRRRSVKVSALAALPNP
jgi:hypothetical protein